MEQPLILDRYRPLAELGSGGHATVTLAYDTKMGRRVAIKRLPLPVETPGAPRRVGLAEARTAALLAHPSIVTVYEWDTDPDEAFLIMESVEGVSLADLLERLGRLDLDEAAAVVGPVADALGFAHDNGVLHLDIKPENVLVTRTGVVKVADFGISALTGLSGTASADEGTPGFMPPEQLRGEPLDSRADQWAFASLVFELLTGANPFEAGTAAEALARAESADIPGPSDLLRGVPIAVDDVLFAALAPNPAERYADVGAFAEALLPHLGDAAAGRRALASTVVELTADDLEEEREAYEHLGLWDRLAPFAGWTTRVLAALVCGWLGFVGLLALSLGPAATTAGTVLVSAAAAAAPGLGLALGLVALAVGGVRAAPLGGFLIAAYGVALWLLLGRKGHADALVAVASPVAAALGVGPLVPLLLGFVFDPLPAALAAAFASLATSAAAALSGGVPPLLTVSFGVLADPWRAAQPSFAAFATPGPYLVMAAWAAAAAVLSWFARRGTRTSAALGGVIATALLFGGYAGWAALLAPGFLPSTAALQQLALSPILMAVVIALGPPVRGEGDDDAVYEEAV